MDEMTQVSPGAQGTRRRRLLYAGGLLAAGTLVGGVLAGTMSALAASNGSSTGATSSTAATSTTATTTAAATAPSAPANAFSSTPVRSDEKALSATDTAKVRAAALAAVPGETVYRVESDAGDGTYEAHMKKADGTLVTVKLDASFAVTKVEAGMGLGDPAPAQAPAASG